MENLLGNVLSYHPRTTVKDADWIGVGGAITIISEMSGDLKAFKCEFIKANA